MHENVLWILNKHATEIITSKKKKMKLLTIELQKYYKNAKICYIFKEKLEIKYVENEKYCKVRDDCHHTEEFRGAVYSICNLKRSVPKKFLQLFITDLIMIIIWS